MPRNFFEYLVSGDIYGDCFIREIVLDNAPMEMKDIAKLLDNDKITITAMDYEAADFVAIKRLAISYDKAIKTDGGRIDFCYDTLYVANPHNISLNTMIHQMSHHDVFMRYFMSRLKRNMPEIVIHNVIEPY